MRRLVYTDAGGFNTSATAWEQWLRFSHLEFEDKFFKGHFVPYTYVDEAGGGREVRREMSPRVALVSTILRAMGLRCPP